MTGLTVKRFLRYPTKTNQPDLTKILNIPSASVLVIANENIFKRFKLCDLIDSS